MSPRLLNVRVNEKEEGKTKELRNERGRWRDVKQVLHANDTVFSAESREDLQYIVNEFGRMCDRMKLKITVDKSKVLVVKEDQRAKKMKENGDGMEEVVKF